MESISRAMMWHGSNVSMMYSRYGCCKKMATDNQNDKFDSDNCSSLRFRLLSNCHVVIAYSSKVCIHN